MMKKNSNREAQIARMQQLADVKGTRMHENKNSLGTLINFKRGADKVAYGIVKENHQYFIKKSNSQGDPNAEDFAYIGGQENITEYRYTRLSEADKNRNMLLITINEALGGKDVLMSQSKSAKATLISEGKDEEKEEDKEHEEKESKEHEEGEKEEKKEDAAEDKKEDKEEKKDSKKPTFEKGVKPDFGKKDDVDEGIKDDLAGAEEKLAGAVEKTAAEPDAAEPISDPVAAEPISDPAVPAPEAPPEEFDVDAINVDGPEGDVEDVEKVTADAEAPAGEVPTEEPAVDPLTGEPVADTEAPVAGTEDGGEFADAPPASTNFQASEELRKIDSDVGSLAELLQSQDLSREEVESVVGRILDPLKDELGDPEKFDIRQRKDLADDNIIKVDVDDAEAEIAATDVEGQEMANMEMAEEKSCDECKFAKYADSRGYGEEELMECSIDEMASLMNGYAMEQEEMDDEDLESMAVFHSDELSETLKEEYANEELTTKLEPFIKKINEVEDTEKKKADSVKGMFWWKVKPQEKKDSTLKTLTNEGMDGNDPAAVETQPMMNEIVWGTPFPKERDERIKFLMGLADQMSDEQLEQFYMAAMKGVNENDEEEVIDSPDAEAAVDAVDAAVDAVDAPEAEVAVDAEIEADPVDAAIVDAPEGDEEAVLDLTKRQEPELDMHAGFESMGGGMPKPDGAPTTTVEVDGGAGTVQVTMSESEKKVRNYIRKRLEEMSGKRKSTLNEDKKSTSVKKLDKMIEQQVSLFESVVEEGNFGANISNFAGKMSQRMGGDIKRQKQLQQALPTIANDEQAIHQWVRDIFGGGKVHRSAEHYIGRATPEVKLDILTQAANDPQGVGMLMANRAGELVYKPVDHVQKIG